MHCYIGTRGYESDHRSGNRLCGQYSDGRDYRAGIHPAFGKDVFQEADITGACEPFVKIQLSCEGCKGIFRESFKEAFYIASTGRQGPVLIDVPIDVQKQEFNYAETGRNFNSGI